MQKVGAFRQWAGIISDKLIKKTRLHRDQGCNQVESPPLSCVKY